LEPLDLAIIGCGAITELAHLPAAARLREVRLGALIDTDLGRAETLAKRFDVECVARDVMELPEAPHAAIVALPHDLHAGVSIALLRRGIHVLVEKPMALSVRDCTEMIDAAAQSGAILAVGLVRRFLPQVAQAKRLIDSGALGPIRGFEVREGRPYDWNPSSDFFLDRKRAGGGVLIEAGVHALDTLLFLLGDLSIVHYADDSYGGVEAEAELRLATGSGAVGIVELSRTRELCNTTFIHGASATLELDLLGRRLTLRRAGSTTDLPIEEGQFGYDVFAAQLADWVDAIRKGLPPSVPGEEGHRSIELIESCYARRTLLELPWVAATRRVKPPVAEVYA
jgi:predicted dehydrogenase